MKFASTRLVAADIKAMVGFYEMIVADPPNGLRRYSRKWSLLGDACDRERRDGGFVQARKR